MYVAVNSHDCVSKTGYGGQRWAGSQGALVLRSGGELVQCLAKYICVGLLYAGSDIRHPLVSNPVLITLLLMSLILLHAMV